jgi:hypothetical protein
MTTARRAPVRRTAKKDDEYVRDPFVYEVKTGEGAGTEITLRSLSWLKPGVFRRIRNLSAGDQVYTLLEMLLSDEDLAAIDDMEPDEFEDMSEAWKKHSGITLGESQASTS